MSQSTGCVYLIGAGCGQADLITLRGLELLRQCDAVVYDDLIADELLQAAPPQAQRIYMGKRLGRHSAPQEEISQTLVELAGQGLRVARLKGGDPFVFGRGGEEALALQAAGIPFQVVPGISSSIAIPALAGIPVTHRGMSRGFHVVTAHTAQGGRDDFDRLANLEGTLVFLMGLSHLGEIAQGLISAGRSPETPAGYGPCPAGTTCCGRGTGKRPASSGDRGRGNRRTGSYFFLRPAFGGSAGGAGRHSHSSAAAERRSFSTGRPLLCCSDLSIGGTALLV